MDDKSAVVEVETKKRKYTLRITRTLINRLDRHLSYVKFIRNKGCSKRAWVLGALREKLEQDKDLDLPDIPKRGVILLELDKEIAGELESKVEMIRDLRGSYSMKSWMVDAIEEKLERDAESVRQNATQKHLNSSGKDRSDTA